MAGFLYHSTDDSEEIKHQKRTYSVLQEVSEPRFPQDEERVQRTIRMEYDNTSLKKYMTT